MFLQAEVLMYRNKIQCVAFALQCVRVIKRHQSMNHLHKSTQYDDIADGHMLNAYVAYKLHGWSRCQCIFFDNFIRVSVKE